MTLVKSYHRASTWIASTCPGRIVAAVLIIGLVSAGGFAVDYFGADGAFVDAE